MKKLQWNRVFRMKEIGIIIPTIILALIAQIFNPVFLSSGNLMNLLRTTSFTLIPALGFTFILIVAGLDLSVGSSMALGGVITGLSLQAGVPLLVSFLLGILGGVCIGLVNGLVIQIFLIPSLIMTLGMDYIARGIVNIITKGVPVYPLPEVFQNLEQSDLWGIPTIVLIAAGFAFIAHFILKYTTFGRELCAVGGNREAARLAGIDVVRVSVIAYILVAVLSAFSGIMVSSRLGSAQPGLGEGQALTVAAAAIIGGTSMFGGSGTIIGTVIGCFFMNGLANSMTLLKVSVFWQKLTIGLILILAVIVDQLNRRNKRS